MALAAGYLAFGWWGVALACLPAALAALFAASVVGTLLIGEAMRRRRHRREMGRGE